MSKETSKKPIFEESGGFKKWSIGVDSEECCVTVKLGHWPLQGEIKLFDIMGDDLERLAEMFRKAAEYYAK